MKRSLLIICIALFLCGTVLLGCYSGVFNYPIAGNQGDNNQADNSNNKEDIHDNNDLQNPDNSESEAPEEEEPEDTKINESATEDVADVLDERNALTSAVELASENGLIYATVPEGALLEEGATELTLGVNELEASAADITLGENESSISIDVHIAGLSCDNESVIKVFVKNLLPVGLNMGNYNLYHVENGKTLLMTLLGDGEPVHNNFEYDPVTGDTTMYLKSFSEIALVSDIENAWNGDYDSTWFEAGKGEYTIANADQLAAFGAIVGGMPINGEYAYTDDEGNHWYTFAGETITLLADVNIGDTDSENGLVFYPIGYYNSTASYEKVSGGSVTSSVYSFEGTFDGNGNTISNFHQNTWEMFGDYNSGYSGTPNHYKDGMGLFGYVYNGTVKNLTVENFSSDGEFTPTGVIAAYAAGNSIFENIAVINSNPRVYNTGNGGIIGIAGDTSSDNVPDNTISLKNITVDNTNKISALWGSWDVACGGLIGMFRGYSELDMNNCHVAAQIDVNNDVCANYQYYWYRYSGMFIGSVRRNAKDTNGYTVAYTENIKATDCTYTLGDWNQYWYCELVTNSLASYTHDHQFSRLTKIASIDEIKSGDAWLKAGNFVIPNADNTAAACYHIFEDADGNLYEHKHTDSGFEDFDLNGDGELNDYKEDRSCYFMPFNQIMNGDGYGVKAHYAFDGIADVTGDGNSYVKFNSIASDVYESGITVSLNELFEAINAESISSPSVQVYVSPVGDASTAGGIYSANVADWEKGTITFSGSGLARVVITDYFYCTETVVELLIKGPMVIYKEGDYVFEAEELDFTNLIPSSGHTAVEIETPTSSTPVTSGGQSLGKCGGGTTSFEIYLKERATLLLYARLSYANGGNAADLLKITLADSELLTSGEIPAGDPDGNRYWNWVDIQFGEKIHLEPGTYTITIEFMSNPNLDCLKFDVISYGSFNCGNECKYCGLCTSESCELPTHEIKCSCPEVDAEIFQEDLYVTLEAENWNFADDTIVSRTDISDKNEYGVKTESGNGAICLFAFTSGTSFTLNVFAESDMTVEMLFRGATDSAGYDVSTHFTLTLNGEAVALPSASISGSGAASYWDWHTVNFGRLNLNKGINEIVLTVVSGHPNIDMVRFISIKPDITVATTGTTTLHMENFDEHKSVIDTKDDFLAVYGSQGMQEGDVYHSVQYGRIYGFNASTFVMHVEVQEACTINISMNLWNSDALNTYSYKFGDQVINCTNETAPTEAGQYEIGSVTVTEAGVYTFIFTTGGVDFDEVIFTVAE